MPVFTGKITWRSDTANKSLQKMVTTIRDFVVASGWTVLDDRISADPLEPYIVVKSTRGTGFAGDDPIVEIGARTNYEVINIINGVSAGVPYPEANNDTNIAGVWYATPYVYVRAVESWNAVTHVGTNHAIWPYNTSIGAPGNATDPTFCPNGSQIAFQLGHDTDLWISVSPEYILMASRWSATDDSNYVDGRGFSIVCGVTCIERLPGDTDVNSFYGNFNSFCWDKKLFYVPKRWDNSVGIASRYGLATKLGLADLRGLSGLDEAGRHLIFDIGVNAAEVGKFKGKLYGVGVSTYGTELGFGLLLPTAIAPQWLVTKHNGLYNYDANSGVTHNNQWNFEAIGDNRMTVLMQVASSIQVIT
jgi:hypothetical protein